MKSLQGWIVVNLVLLSALVYQGVHSQKCSKKSDIVIVLDQSGSITDTNPRNGSWDNWVLCKNFVIELIRNSDVSYDGVHFGLVTFGNYGITRFGLLEHLTVDSLVTAVRAISPGNGQTNLYGGLYAARTEVFVNSRTDVPRIIIIITDGFANIYTEKTIPEAETLHNMGIRIYAVGVTDQINEDQLKAISSPPHNKGAQYWTTPDFTSLNSIVQSVQNATCDPAKETFEYCDRIDICFAIDVPQSSTDFLIVKSFIKSYIYRYLLVGADNVRICVFTFDGRQATLRIRLNQYYVEDDLDLAIDNIPFVASGTADPTYAFQFAVNTAFTPVNGYRGTDFKPTLVLMLNNALPNRAAAIDAYNTMAARGIKSIPLGMTYDISISELGVLAYVTSDVVSSTAYDQLNSKLDQLSGVMCRNNSLPCPIKADICLLLDQSTSIIAAPGGYENWNNYILGFAKAVASAFPISMDDTRIGVAKFSDSASPSFYLTDYTTSDTLLNAIGKLTIDGGETNIAAGLRVCRQQIFTRGSRPDVPHILIMITDGRANREPSQTIPEANLTKAEGVNIFTVGITNNVDVTQLRQICTFPPETHYFYVDNFSKLNTILNDLVSKSCIGPATTTTRISSPSSASSTTTTTSPSTSSSTTTTTSPTTSSSTSSQSTSTTSPTTSTDSPSSSSSSTRSSTTILSPTSSRTTTVVETPTTRVTTVCTSYTEHLTYFTSTTGPNTPPSQAVCPTVADVVLILDESTSIVYARGTYDNWYKHILGFAASIAGSFDIGPTKTQVGVEKFSEDAIPSIYLYDFSDVASLKAAILSLSITGGETNIASACRLSRLTMYNSRFGARPGVRKIAILVTDGEANREVNQTIPEADLLKRSGVELFTIGITDRTDAGQLRRICTQPSDTHYFYVDDYSQLSTIKNAVMSRVCNSVVDDATTKTTTGAPPSSSTITSTSSSSSASTTSSSTSSSSSQSPSTSSRSASPFSSSTTSSPAPHPTTQADIPPTCSAVADIILILDESTSIVYAEGSYTNWYTHILGFAKNFTSSFTISPSYTQIGVMKFSGSYTIAFYLNTYNNAQAVVNAIGELGINGGETNIAAALRVARTTMCTTAQGHRTNAKCIVVLVTDGEANREANMTLPEADLDKQSGIEIFTVGVTKRVNTVQLQSIASPPVSTHYYYVDDYKQLGNIVTSIRTNVCNAVRVERSN